MIERHPSGQYTEEYARHLMQTMSQFIVYGDGDVPQEPSEAAVRESIERYRLTRPMSVKSGDTICLEIHQFLRHRDKDKYPPYEKILASIPDLIHVREICDWCEECQTDGHDDDFEIEDQGEGPVCVMCETPAVFTPLYHILARDRVRSAQDLRWEKIRPLRKGVEVATITALGAVDVWVNDSATGPELRKAHAELKEALRLLHEAENEDAKGASEPLPEPHPPALLNPEPEPG